MIIVIASNNQPLATSNQIAIYQAWVHQQIPDTQYIQQFKYANIVSTVPCTNHVLICDYYMAPNFHEIIFSWILTLCITKMFDSKISALYIRCTCTRSLWVYLNNYFKLVRKLVLKSSLQSPNVNLSHTIPFCSSYSCGKWGGAKAATQCNWTTRSCSVYPAWNSFNIYAKTESHH